MRVLGFSQMWPKLKKDTFTTFRFARRDTDWQVGEVVQIVFKPRRKGGGQKLGTAKILNKEPRCMAWHGSKLTEPKVTNHEAIADGFEDTFLEPKFNFPPLVKKAYFNMWEWLYDTYKARRLLDEPMNKITLRWVERG